MMKNLLLAIILVVFTANVWAQSPNKMSYQAVIRDASDALVINQPVGMKISFLQGSANGAAVYEETQTVSTNNNGLVSIEIGSGTTIDDFSAIDWSAGPYFIKTETDPAGGTNYSISGTSQLLSVPYALYAASSGSTVSGNFVDLTTDQNIFGNKSFNDAIKIGTSTWNTTGKLQTWNTAFEGHAFEAVGNNENFVGPATQFWTRGQGPTMNIDWAGTGTNKLVTFKYFGTDVGHITTMGGAWFNDSVGIGTSTPTAKLDVLGAVKIADGTQGEGKVLTSDANGLASWQDASQQSNLSVTHYGQPAITLENDKETNIHFGTTIYNTNIGYADGAVTVPSFGFYHFDISISFPFVYTNEYKVELLVYINGGLYSQEFLNRFSFDLKLNANDVVTFGVKQHSGSDHDLSPFARLYCHKLN